MFKVRFLPVEFVFERFFYDFGLFLCQYNALFYSIKRQLFVLIVLFASKTSKTLLAKRFSKVKLNGNVGF